MMSSRVKEEPVITLDHSGEAIKLEKSNVTAKVETEAVPDPGPDKTVDFGQQQFHGKGPFPASGREESNNDDLRIEGEPVSVDQFSEAMKVEESDVTVKVKAGAAPNPDPDKTVDFGEQQRRQFHGIGEMKARKKRNQILSRTCIFCGKYCRRAPAQLMRHLLDHVGESPHFCSKCDVVCKSSEGLKRHVKANHSGKKKEKERELKCGTCGQLFKHLRSLRRHEFNHQKKGLSCELCPKKFKRQWNLGLHLRRVHNKVIEVEEEPKRNRGIRFANLTCVFCDKTIRSSNEFMVHTWGHTDESPYFCGRIGCDATFRYPSSLDFHLKARHANDKDDDALCSTEVQIREKKKMKDLNARVCVFCEKRFRDRQRLYNHIRSHVGETPFHCDNCEMAYPSVHSLRCHTKKCHKGVFKCNLCERSFEVADQLQEHQISYHTRKFKCTICSKLFVKKPHLTQHLLLVHQIKDASGHIQVLEKSPPPARNSMPPPAPPRPHCRVCFVISMFQLDVECKVHGE